MVFKSSTIRREQSIVVFRDFELSSFPCFHISKTFSRFVFQIISKMNTYVIIGICIGVSTIVVSVVYYFVRLVCKREAEDRALRYAVPSEYDPMQNPAIRRPPSEQRPRPKAERVKRVSKRTEPSFHEEPIDDQAPPASVIVPMVPQHDPEPFRPSNAPLTIAHQAHDVYIHDLGSNSVRVTYTKTPNRFFPV